MDSRITSGLGGAGQGASIGSAFGPWGAGIGAVVGGIGGVLSGGDDAEKLAEEQAELIEATARENRRRSMQEMEQVIGYTKAATYASNLQDTGSTRKYRMTLESQFRRDMAWDDFVARKNAETTRAGGRAAQSQIDTSGVLNMITGLGAASDAGLFGTYSTDKGYTAPWGK